MPQAYSGRVPGSQADRAGSVVSLGSPEMGNVRVPGAARFALHRPLQGEKAMKHEGAAGKDEALRAEGALNRHPERVTDEAFGASDFFDARDLVQVKYEMLRRVRQEEQTVTQAAAAFGFSRPAFYQAQAALAEGGMAGLLPRRPGPRGPHKLNAEVMEFVEEVRREEPPVSMPALLQRLWERFGVRVHRRSVERALARRTRKKGGGQAL